MSPPALPWDVPTPFTLGVTVADSDLDEFGHTNNVRYLAWLERVAWAHSNQLGMDMAAYRRLGAGCVARRHEVDYLAPSFVGEELLLGTWIHENDFRLTMWRAYQVIRVIDQRTLLRGKTLWVSVDLATGKPRRMPAEFVAAYRPFSALGQAAP